jgi:hypothetical protein
VELVDPRAQKYPAVHGPLHADVVSPVLLPNRPASQEPQEVAAPTLNLPAGHMVVAPLVQKKPAGLQNKGATQGTGGCQ